MTRTIISLSTIPPRFDQLEPTLRALLAQKDPADAIEINIPQRYRRFPHWDGTLPVVPAGVTLCRVDDDLGPASKILPTVQRYRGQDVDVVFCDDDKCYDPDWLARFKRLARQMPGSCLCEAGETFPDINDAARPPQRLPRMQRIRKNGLYRLIRILSLTTYKPHQFSASGHVDMLCGYGGVRVRPEFFPDEAFNIPDILWTVDDTWLSGMLEVAGVPIWLNADAPRPRGSRAGEVEPLVKLVDQDHDRVEADLACIAYFRKHYGIWPSDAKAAQQALTHSADRLTPWQKEAARRAVAASNPA